MSYKDALYRRYVSTHIGNRKNIGGIAGLKCQSHGFQQHFGSCLPESKHAKIADLGCGSGGLVWWLQSRGYLNVHGVDASAEQVKVARELGVNSISEGDVFDFLANEKEFDVLFARDLVEHFEKQMVFDFLNVTFDSLGSQGVLVLQLPNAESPYFGRVRYGDFTHELAFTSSSIMQLLKAVGFDNIDVFPWYPVVTGWRGALRYILWRILQPVLKLPIFIESGKKNSIVTMNLIVVARK